MSPKISVEESLSYRHFLAVNYGSSLLNSQERLSVSLTTDFELCLSRQRQQDTSNNYTSKPATTATSLSSHKLVDIYFNKARNSK